MFTVFQFLFKINNQKAFLSFCNRISSKKTKIKTLSPRSLSSFALVNIRRVFPLPQLAMKTRWEFCNVSIWPCVRQHHKWTVLADPASFIAFLTSLGKFPFVGRATAHAQNSRYLHIIKNSFSVSPWLVGSRNIKKWMYNYVYCKKLVYMYLKDPIVL